MAANCSVAVAADAAATDDFYGVNAQPLFYQPGARWQPQLAAISAGGLQLVRTDARWWSVEPDAPSGGNHTYDWSYYDGVVGALSDNGLRWYPALESAPDWASDGAGDQSPAASHIGDFAAFAAALASRYGPDGSFWRTHPSNDPMPVLDYEIWNEENSAVFWQSQADAPERYADLYAAARQAIHAVVPQSHVVVGGLALDNPPVVQDELGFLARMLAHRPDLRGAVDAVGLHPYQATLANTNMRLDRFRQGVDQLLGPSVPISVTEVGWASTAVPEAERAADLAGLAAELPGSNCRVDHLLPYAWTTPESDPVDPESWFGIWNLDVSPKPSGAAYTQTVLGMRGLAGQAPPRPADPCPPPPSTDASGPPRGPSLKLRALLDRRHGRVQVFARCPAGCSLKLALLRRRASALVPVGHRRAKFTTRRRHFRIRYPHRTRALRLDVLATGTGGGRTSRVRHLRVVPRSVRLR